MAGNLDGVFVMGRGEMQRQVRVEEILLELDAGLFLVVSRNTNVEPEWRSPHDNLRRRSK